MLSSAVTTKGQVTIPSAIREKLHIHPGDKISFTIEDNRVVITRKINDITAAFGLIKSDKTATLTDMENAIKKGGANVRD